MSQDLLIPFLPRVVQNKLESPKLNVKRIVKEPWVSEDGHQSETQNEVYEQNNIVVAQRHRSQGDHKDNSHTDADESPDEQLNEEAQNAQASEQTPEQATEQNMDYQIHTVRTKAQIEQALAKQAAFEHPVYEKEEILHPQKHKQDSQTSDPKNPDDDDHHVDIII